MSNPKARAKSAHRRHKYGPLLRDAQPVRDHIETLRAQGATYASIEAQCGVHRDLIWRIARRKPRQRSVERETALAILAVTHPVPGFWVCATGTRRRVEALVYLGYSLLAIDRERGVTKCVTQKIFHQSTVSRVTACEIRELYDRLSTVPPVGGDKFERMSITNAKTLARRKGFAPPAAWDDIDDPNELPKGAGGVVYRKGLTERSRIGRAA